MNTKIFKISLFLIIVYGIFLRGYNLWLQSFWIDEWYSAIVSLTNGIHDLSYYLHTIFQSLSFFLLWHSDFSARIPSFLFWVWSIYIFYLFSKSLFEGKEFWNIWIIITLFLFIFSTSEIVWARDARFYELLNFIVLSALYFLWKYSENWKMQYFFYYLWITLVWMIFHPFCISLFAIWVIFMIYKWISDYIKKESLKKYYIPFLSLIIWFILYIIISLVIKNLSNGLDINWNFTSTPTLSEEMQKGYIKYYLLSVWENLWILLPLFLVGIIYFAHTLQIKKLIIFGWFFAINFYTISQEGYLAHTRYMFHLYSIIILMWGYTAFVVISFLYNKYKKVYSYIFISILLLLTLNTFQFSVIPESHYYIDESSPKPDFKKIYTYLDTVENVKIISWFPHMCVWYNLDEKEKCAFALWVNLIGSERDELGMKALISERYTNIPYIWSLSSIKKEEYYFVLDDLTIKNALQKDIINEVLETCDLLLSDKWNGKEYNSIWLWKCSK